MNRKKLTTSSYIRNFTFGVEDSLASTVGLLSGIASADVKSSTIILTGLVLIFTEALSMGVGSFLTEESVEEYEHHRDLPLSRTLPSAFIMFFSYLIAGLVPIFPYAILPLPYSLYLSIAMAIMGLILLGAFNAKVSHTNLKTSVIRMFILGGSVAVAGVIVGKLLEMYTGIKV
jgi:VIT1/CCC1 family predicted Fe2+/Mn2+ transporter